MTKIKKLREHGITTDNRTYIIAEIGINHGGDLGLAKKIIDSAARTGVDAVKFQTYLTEKRAPKGNQAVFDILKKCELPFASFDELRHYAGSVGLDFFSTPFDRESVDYLESIDCQMYKVASFDVVNHELLRRVAASGKPVLMSVGMATAAEIAEAYRILKKGTDRIVILHCVSAYPVGEKDVNLAAIYALKEAYDCIIGYSDHTPQIKAPLYAVAAGAQVIEKHYRIDDQMDCIDAAVSITEQQMQEMIAEIRHIEEMFGDGSLGVRKIEEPITVFRRLSA